MSEHNTSGAGIDRAPLYEALLVYRDSKQRSFHVPGHKMDKSIINGFNCPRQLEDIQKKVKGIF